MAITITRPTVNGSNNTWGTTINTGLEALESTLNGTGTGKVTISPDLDTLTINGVDVTSDAADLNLLDGAAAATVVDGKVVVHGDDGEIVVNQVFEKVTTDTSTSGTISFDANSQAVMFFTANQTANRTINFRGDSSTSLDNTLAIGQSMTVAILATQGSTAYYLDAYQIDGSSVTPKWSGGEAPSEGNASGIDVYHFTIIKTAAATFTVIASQTQFA